VEISQDYPLKTRTSKQPIREVSGYEIIPSNTLEVNKASEGRKQQFVQRRRGNLLGECSESSGLETSQLLV
jgi:hypothetical protein